MRKQYHPEISTGFVIFVVFLLTSALAPQPAQAQTKFKVLHTFHGKDGANPVGQFVRDADGNLYSTTANGGTGKCPQGPACGTVFKMNSHGKLLWSYSLKDYKDGFETSAGVFQDAEGNFYGTTVYGGLVPCYTGDTLGCGTVFKLDKTGKKETVLYRFKGSSNGNQDGWIPESLLVGDVAGNVYGTTIWGGTGSNGGTVFKVNQAGKETILINFPGYPYGQCCPGPGLIFRPDEKLYGLTQGGGSYNMGTGFRTSVRGKESVFYNFSSDAPGPYAVLAPDSAGNLYGVTRGGGNNCGINGCGTVFELSPSGGSWTEKTLYTFCQLSECKDGQAPYVGPLAVDAVGNIYGTTIFGGDYRNCNGDSCGVVYKLTPNGQETVLHSFTGGTDGAYPVGVIMDAAGNLYGAAAQGGDPNCPGTSGHGCGLIFEITP